jgi:hypothetical protein
MGLGLQRQQQLVLPLGQLVRLLRQVPLPLALLPAACLDG